MKRAIILVLDSLGLGSSADAHRYGDKGADTLGHIAKLALMVMQIIVTAKDH